VTRIVLACIGALFAAAMVYALTAMTGLERRVFSVGTGFCALLFAIAIIHPDTKGR
jgi:hypothetical protein